MIGFWSKFLDFPWELCDEDLCGPRFEVDLPSHHSGSCVVRVWLKIGFSAKSLKLSISKSKFNRHSVEIFNFAGVAVVETRWNPLGDSPINLRVFLVGLVCFLFNFVKSPSSSVMRGPMPATIGGGD